MSTVLKYNGYIGSAEVDCESGVCHGKLLYIRDLISYSAESPKELKAAFEAAVDDYVETSAELGREPEKPCSGTFNVRVSPDLHLALNLAARRENISLNALVNEALSTRIGPHTVKHEHTLKMVIHEKWQDLTVDHETREPAWPIH